MQRIGPILLGVAMASAGLISAAPAADMPRLYQMSAPLPGLYNWTGFYIGGQGGYGGGSFDISPRGTDIDGWFAGGTMGLNWQSAGSPWVFGVEADAAFADIERSVDQITGYSFNSAYSKVNSFGSVRLRAGYAADRALLYGTGGLAWAHNEVTLYANQNYSGMLATSANTHVGFAAGLGFEWALSRNWTMKAEFLYNDFGPANYLAGSVAGGVNADLRFSTGRVGLNYMFDWGRPFTGAKF